MSDAKLTFTIKNTKPIELLNYTHSLQGISNQYTKFLNESEDFAATKDAKLHIKEIKSGCIITELQDLLYNTLPYAEYTNSIVAFTTTLIKVLKYFKGETKEKPKDLDLKDCSNVNDIVNPIANDVGSSIVFNSTVENIVVNYTINNIDANAIQNGVKREIELIKEPKEDTKNKTLFHWDSAKYDSTSKSIDKGYIEELYSEPLKTIFADDSTKDSMLNIVDNPFHKAYIVDVQVQTINKIPTIYKILRVHETFDR